MFRSARRQKDEFLTSFANDIIIATGKLPLYSEFIRYRISSDTAAQFDLWIQDVFVHLKKSKNPILFESLPQIYAVTAPSIESALPTLTMISPSEDASHRNYLFAAKRILEHPLAREFKAVIPWLYKECFQSFRQFISQSFDKMTLSDIYIQIENMKIFNSRLMRKTALEPIVFKLRYLLFTDFWKMLSLKFSSTEFLVNTTYLLKQFRDNTYTGILLPLPKEEEWFLTGVIFWMQLIEGTSKNKTDYWEIYWFGKTEYQEASLLFYKGKLPAEELALFWQGKELSKKIANTLEISGSSFHHFISINSLISDKPLSLITLLSRWCKKIID